MNLHKLLGSIKIILDCHALAEQGRGNPEIFVGNSKQIGGVATKSGLIRPFSKLACANKCEEPTERRSAVYSDVHEHSSTGVTMHLAAEVEFRKRSIEDLINSPKQVLDDSMILALQNKEAGNPFSEKELKDIVVQCSQHMLAA